jgi:hypothetical protein
MVNHYGQRWLGWIPFLHLEGLAIGNHIFYYDETPSEQLVRHEETHVRQYRRMSVAGIMPIGILLYCVRWWAELLLGILCYRNGEAYSKISLEIEARLEGGDCLWL